MKFNLQLFALKKKNMVFINDGASATPKTAEKKDNKPAEKKNVGTANVTTPVVNTNVASTPVTSTVNGVDENTSAKMQSVFTQSQGVTDAQKEAGQYRDKLKEISSVTDVIDQATWDEIFDQYSGIENTSFRNSEVFPTLNNSNGNTRAAGNFRRNGSESMSTRTSYARTTTQTQFPGRDLGLGAQDPIRQEVVR